MTVIVCLASYILTFYMCSFMFRQTQESMQIYEAFSLHNSFFSITLPWKIHVLHPPKF